MSDAAPQEPLVTHLKRAGEQVLGAKPLTGNDHVRLSALLKVAALEIEALCVVRDDAAELRAAAKRYLTGLEECEENQYPKGSIGHYEKNRALEALRAALAASEGQP